MLVCTFLTYHYNALHLHSNCKSIDYMSQILPVVFTNNSVNQTIRKRIMRKSPFITNGLFLMIIVVLQIIVYRINVI